ncbi:AAA family ATPase [Vacuolonema iberomarrocanum]|uniref:AAA family ATPase n=1 Tax=Vacuolonema iberomarrocanum TaxID=3454632 RepID=UPI001A073527|nr:ATP-binding protein [filamentous cyanobacterium LEGE 07170]
MLSGNLGLGKTTLVEALHNRLGGKVFQMKDFIDSLRQHHPLAIEEVFEQLVMDALNGHDVVFVDDMHLLCNLTYQGHAYPRAHLLNIPVQILSSYAVRTNKKLIFSGQPYALSTLAQEACYVGMARFQIEDYQALCQHYVRDEAIALDYAKIYRFASKLNAYQLKDACLSLRRKNHLETEHFINYLKARQLISNINLEEIQAVDLNTLKGVDDVIESLEANIILPLENDALATEFDLKPKRGVLLAGPPGTGKTTIGRALARRLKSKFFLIDGTFISGTGDFYGGVHRVFEAAKQNAPSIVFIDDGDVIFEGGDELGFYRYLLTLLDGLESESVGRVCLMMTAMQASSLPPALVRSGRIELWLELRLPNDDARSAILKQHLCQLPTVLSNVDVSRLVSETNDFTGADLKRLIEDGKTLYAYDCSRQRPLRSATEYFLSAVELVKNNKAIYAQADSQARQQHSVKHGYRGTMRISRQNMIE